MYKPGVSLVGTYIGSRDKWAIGRFTEDGSPSMYFIGVHVHGAISFNTGKGFSSREDAEGWLVYHIDETVKL